MSRVRIDKRKLERLVTTNSQRADQFWRSVTQEVLNDIVLSFGTSPPGQTYQRRSVTHVASQPGNPPNVDTGTLRASMKWQPAGRLRTIISDGVEYGIYLEQGTTHMAARPFVAPVFYAWRTRKMAQYARQYGLFNVL